jgi:hypothetical protein
VSNGRDHGNLCQSEQNSKLRASLSALVVGLALAVALARIDASIAARATIFLPLVLAATWLLQAIGKT